MSTRQWTATISTNISAARPLRLEWSTAGRRRFSSPIWLIRKPLNITLEKYIGREMRARYLNPKWINEMMKQGYAGARFVDHVVEYMYGWSVTTPEAIGDAKWQEMYETWVEDRNHLDIKQKFRDASNLSAYQALVDRMLVAVDKGYWKADPATVANLEKVNYEMISEAGVSSNRDTSSSPKIMALADAQERKAMGLAKLQPAALGRSNCGQCGGRPPAGAVRSHFAVRSPKWGGATAADQNQGGRDQEGRWLCGGGSRA